ncbi:MAG: GH39 family glycosyl hydrolase [Candidatus Zixiibacteriota bacterium]
MKKLIVSLAFLFCIISIFGNLITNSRFDSGSSGWFELTDPDSLEMGYIQRWCSDCGRSSTGGFHLYLPDEAGRYLGYGFVITEFEPEQIYKLSYDVKYNCIAPPHITCLFLNESMEVVGDANRIAIAGEGDWRRIELHVHVPDSIGALIVGFAAYAEGEYWFDNCSLSIADTSYRDIIIDFDNEIGMIRNLSGINCGPKIPNSTLDLTEGFENLQIPMIRTHDWYGPGDRHVIFPDWDADPEDPSNYDFASTDTFVTSIVDFGGEVFFRLGESWPTSADSFNSPPPDNDVWAKVCKNIVRHYNDGWADGFYYDINYWEIWNEPDLDIFWTGTSEEYYEMYITVAETLKAYDPSLKIGGPCVADVFNRNYIDGFIDAIDSAGIGLDFFSWHWYEPKTPYNIYSANKALKQYLGYRGYGDIEIIQNEWNMTVFEVTEDFEFEPVFELANTSINAAFCAGMLTLFQDAPIEHLMRYRANNELFGLFLDEDTYTYSGKSFELFTELYDRPVRVEALNSSESCCAESTSMAIIAGKDDHEIAILIADWSSNRNGYNLTVNNLPEDVEYKYEVIALNDSIFSEIVDSAIFISDGSFEISVPMRAPATNLIKLYDISGSIIAEEDIFIEEQFIVWPNPFENELHILTNENKTIEIYNILGNLVDRVKPGSGSEYIWYPSDKLESGIYFIRGQFSNVSCKTILYVD